MSENILFKCSQLYYANLQATEDIIINQGGTDSGKTYAICQVLLTIATTEPAPKQDPVITVAGATVNDLKKGAYRTTKSIIANSKTLQSYILKHNETDRTIYFKSGWIIEFNSYETPDMAQQGKRQYLFVNEARNMSWLIFWVLCKKTRCKTFIDYNPTERFWSHDNLIGTTPASNDFSKTVRLIISDHRHNPFLTEQQHRQTEGIKDKDLWNVYARGRTGNISGVIFPNWQKISDDKFPNDEEFIGGLDFGYTNDPTTAVKIVRIGETVYLKELCYTPGLHHNQIAQILRANGFTSQPVFCDHDPEIINPLRTIGIVAIAARKGQGSVKAGIVLLKSLKIFYTESSVNLANEIPRYIWLKNPDTGKETNTPIDMFNHAIDAARMGIYTYYGGSSAAM